MDTEHTIIIIIITIFVELQLQQFTHEMISLNLNYVLMNLGVLLDFN